MLATSSPSYLWSTKNFLLRKNASSEIDDSRSINDLDRTSGKYHITYCRNSPSLGQAGSERFSNFSLMTVCRRLSGLMKSVARCGMHRANSLDATDTSTRTSSYTAAENGTKSTTILAKRYKYFSINRLDNVFEDFKGLQNTLGVMASGLES